MRALLVLSLALSGCSFTTATGFTECAVDLDCGSTSACSHGYCLPLPAGCRRENTGETNEPEKRINRIPVVMLLAINALSGFDESELQEINAVKLALSEVNPRLSAERGPFGLFVCDSDPQLNPLGVTQQAPWFIQNLEAPALVVSSSDPLNRIAQLEARLDAGTLLISPNATSPQLESTFRTTGNVWRMAPPDDVQAKVLVDLIAQQFPDAGVRIPIFAIRGDYGAGFSTPLFDRLQQRGFTPTLHDFIRDDPASRTDAVTRANNSMVPPAASVIIGFPADVVAIVNQARLLPWFSKANGHAWYLADAAKDPQIVTDTTAPELAGALGTAPAQGAGNGYSIFRERFVGRYGVDPGSFGYSSHAYDAAWLLMLSTQAALGRENVRANLTGPQLGEALARITVPVGSPTRFSENAWQPLSTAVIAQDPVNLEGASGPLDFNLTEGFAPSSYEVWVVEGDGGIRVDRLLAPQ